ncbi:MAG: DUF2141 domain-containing protein [Alphaproteobacteria bacterium]
MKKILLGTAFALGMAGAAQAGPINLAVTEVENDKGHVVVAVYKKGDFSGSKDGPPPAYSDKAAAQAGAVNFTFAEVVPGDYTIVVFHDENDNEDVDTTWIGLPKEGIGFSNNAKINMGPPAESDMLFAVGDDGAEQSIALVY